MNRGFADLRLSHLATPPENWAGDEGWTRDPHLGKVVFYHWTTPAFISSQIYKLIQNNARLFLIFILFFFEIMPYSLLRNLSNIRFRRDLISAVFFLPTLNRNKTKKDNIIITVNFNIRNFQLI